MASSSQSSPDICAALHPHPLSSVAFVDTHVHHHAVAEKFCVEVQDLRARFPLNFDKCVNVLCDVADIENEVLFQTLVDIDWMTLSLGVHPQQAKDYTDELEAKIEMTMSHPKVVAWGEIGLDYYYDNSPSAQLFDRVRKRRDIQGIVFAKQIRAAVRCNKPIVVHTREAEDDTWDLMKEHIPENWFIHVHCFTSSPELAEKLVAHFPNLYIGITGVVTYKSAENTQKVARDLPLERILLETDSPYMVPAQVNARKRSAEERVKICHSGYIPYVAEKVAKLRGIELDEVLKVCTANARRIYGLAILDAEAPQTT
ncbi:MAG: hypothetical protein BJ554DRAFT_6877 [Olpidium bornovanus]|uniref:TatD related DNase n=1 Tax=Olpidium bornovanus TaxID=278681 RepID=A0A8H8DJN7_9FUNG|nr:MAG: hypothetical protein BJ554DRAFT_6877 [Olpidium bornovanus]